MIARILIGLVILATTCHAPGAYAQNTATPGTEKNDVFESADSAGTEKADAGKSLERILEGLETRYSTPGFTARFSQESTLKAMDITDTAAGTVMVKRPGMMRWEYETPEPQTIITDGDRLWIYRPEDNQVMLGKAPAFFKDGKGAGFLSDMKLLREKFAISTDLGQPNRDLIDDEDDYYLKLVPEDPNLDLAVIFLAIEKDTFAIENITTLNAYEDETRIRLYDYDFGAELENDLFRFTIPEGVDILELEE